MSASRLRILGLMLTSSWLFVGCSSAKKIDAGGSCVLNSDCNQSLVCTAGKCHDACHISADCPAGQSCIIASDQSTVCQLPVETHCAYNSECQPPLMCAADLRCRNQCQTDVDCTNGQICTTTKTCAEPNQVDSDNNLIGPDGGVGGSGGVSDAGGLGGSGGGDAGVADALAGQPDVAIGGTGGTGAGGELGGTAAGGTATGGAGATGGTTGMGGAPSAGGNTRTGGTTASGGTTTTGGTGVGGSGGRGDAGVADALAGQPDVAIGGTGGTGAGGELGGMGGTAATIAGGTTGGGAVNTGGTNATGGVTSSGGATNSGGATGQCGILGEGAGGASGGNAGAIGSGTGGSPVVVFTDDFESGIGLWYADNGVWEVGTPGAGPSACYQGQSCAATILNGNYPDRTVSRLISPSVTLPSLSAGEELSLRFWNWFSYAFGGSGQVQVSVWDTGLSAWSAWQSEGQAVSTSSGVWSFKAVDLTAYAGQRIRIAFLHTGYSNYVSTGWYLDSVQVVQFTPMFGGDFELGWGDWYADNGVWEVGTPGAGPSACYQGQSCAATVLNGNYPGSTVSRLVSPSVTLPNLSAGEELSLRFWNWFSYASNGSGQVQVSAWDTGLSAWSAWQSRGQAVSSSSGGWSFNAVDLAAYAGQRIRIAFLHTGGSVSTGWYVDSVQLVQFTPMFGGDFDSGWGDWYADNGVWQVGAPTVGPPSCYQGAGCAGTVLDGNYPNSTVSRLISPSVTLPNLAVGGQMQVRFWHWFSYACNGSGQVQVSDWDPQSSTWSAWANVDQAVTGTSTTWTLKAVDLTAHSGKRVRIALSHTGYSSCGSPGWYVDSFGFVCF